MDKPYILSKSLVKRNLVAAGIWCLVTGCRPGLPPEVSVDKRIVGDGEYKEEFSVIRKKPAPGKNRYYYWYRSGKLHKTRDNYSGELVEGPYARYYYPSELAEKGNFREGLKHGRWMEWYRNGNLSRITYWKKGKQVGKETAFDSLGQITIYGRYGNGRKKGKWINKITGDTIRYRKGREVIRDTAAATDSTRRKFFVLRWLKRGDTTDIIPERGEKKGLLKKIFTRDTLSREQRKKDRKYKKELKKRLKNGEEQQGILKKWFGRREKKQEKQKERKKRDKK